MKNFKLLRDYEWPGGYISQGTIKSEVEWDEIFPTLTWDDYERNTDWFEKIALTHEERYDLDKDRLAQIRCLRHNCFHNEAGKCLNISPAITLGEEKARCWSFNEIEEEDLEDELQEACDVDDAGVISMRDKWNRDSLDLEDL